VLFGRADGGGGAAVCVTPGVIFKNDLKPTWLYAP
jgi:hypothetical protein